MQSRKRKRAKDRVSLSGNAITNNMCNPLKKRKTTRSYSDDESICTCNKENTPHTNNKEYVVSDNDEDNNNNHNIDNNNMDDDIFNSDIENNRDEMDNITPEISLTPITTYDSCTLSPMDDISHMTYSDGIWSILVPTNTNNASILIQCDTFRIGRDKCNDLVLSDMLISATHCCITNNKIRDKILIVDGSKNGTFIGDDQLEKNQEYQLQNGHLISLTEADKFNYYFFVIKYFESYANDQNQNETDEFNVSLNKIDTTYYLKINEKETVYDETICNRKCLSELIAGCVDIPVTVSNVIIDFYGDDIMDIIASNIGLQRPKQRINRPMLIRSNTMCGSPIQGLTQEY